MNCKAPRASSASASSVLPGVKIGCHRCARRQISPHPPPTPSTRHRAADEQHPRAVADCIGRAAPKNDALQAATCFNQIMLPPYDSVDTMRSKLELAINETGGFGLK